MVMGLLQRGYNATVGDGSLTPIKETANAISLTQARCSAFKELEATYGICRCVGIRQIDSGRSNFISPCGRQGFHGKNRSIARTDFRHVPFDKSAFQSTTVP